MDTWHYDQSDPDAVGDAGVEVEHIYCLDHMQFTPEDDEALDGIFRTLPGYDAVSGGWFGGKLLCSCEPPGFQVFGLLPADTWRDWHEKFVAAVEASSLPRRIVSRIDP